MTKRVGGGVALLAVAVLLGGAEVGLRCWKDPEAVVQVENLGAEPIEDLVVDCGASRVVVPWLEAGATARVRVCGRGPQTLRLNYQQKGNALGSYQLPGFDPEQMSQLRSKLVLRLRPNTVERFQDDAGATSPLGRLVRFIAVGIGAQSEDEAE